MKLSRSVSYAVQATLHLARSSSKTPIPCRKLASAGQMPERFLLQILRDLVAHGVLVSTRGVDGGYALERPPEEISLLEVIEAVSGPLTSAFPAGEGLPQETKARLEEALAHIAEESRRELEAVKLAQLLPRS